MRNQDPFGAMTNNEVESAVITAANGTEGFSGRTLRKLPFLAHANYIQQSEPCSGLEFAEALNNAVSDERRARESLVAGNSDGV